VVTLPFLQISADYQIRQTNKRWKYLHAHIIYIYIYMGCTGCRFSGRIPDNSIKKTRIYTNIYINLLLLIIFKCMSIAPAYDKKVQQKRTHWK